MMEASDATPLLIKGLWSAVIVLCLSGIAERVSTRIAGILSGAPLGSVFVYFFVGRDMGIPYVMESIPHGIAAFTATLAFIFAYHRVASVTVRASAALSALVSVSVFAMLAVLLERIAFTLSTALVLTLSCCTVAVWLFRGTLVVPVVRPVRFTIRVLVVRSVLAAGFVVTVVVLAKALGSRWTGVLTGFPMTLLPTLLIIHSTYGPSTTQGILRNVPLGISATIVYILLVMTTFPHLGVIAGTVVSLIGSVLYLCTVMLWVSRTRGAAGR